MDDVLEDDDEHSSTALAKRADQALQLTGGSSVPSQYDCHQGVMCAERLRTCGALQLDVNTCLNGLHSFTLKGTSKGCMFLV